MATSQAAWVLLLDHDVYVALNPLWYDVCLETIQQLNGRNVGLITCREYIGGTIEDAIRQARGEYECGLRPRRIERAEEVAGYFMLVNHRAWMVSQFRAVGKGVNKVDHDFARRLMERDYELYMIEGLWVYHRRGVRKQRVEWKGVLQR